MPQKASRIDDVKRPDKVTPGATARPILVTNRPTMMNDPMMAPPDEAASVNPQAAALSHTAKAVAPLGSGPAAALAESNQADSAADGKIISEDATAKPIESDPPADTEKEAADADRNPDAAASAKEVAAAEARVKREQELEDLIAGGKYTVPINAVQRKRSRTDTLLLATLAVVLILVLLDAVLDVGIIKLPSTIPHTHFFSQR